MGQRCPLSAVHIRQVTKISFLQKLKVVMKTHSILRSGNHLKTKGHLTSFPHKEDWAHGNLSSGEWIQRNRNSSRTYSYTS